MALFGIFTLLISLCLFGRILTDRNCGDPKIGPVLQGVDFVDYVTKYQETGVLTTPTIGSKEYVAKLDDYSFWFKSSENAKKFEANPSAYYPQYGGYCAWGLTGYDKHISDPRGYDTSLF